MCVPLLNGINIKFLISNKWHVLVSLNRNILIGVCVYLELINIQIKNMTINIQINLKLLRLFYSRRKIS